MHSQDIDCRPYTDHRPSTTWREHRVDPQSYLDALDARGLVAPFTLIPGRYLYKIWIDVMHANALGFSARATANIILHVARLRGGVGLNIKPHLRALYAEYCQCSSSQHLTSNREEFTRERLHLTGGNASFVYISTQGG